VVTPGHSWSLPVTPGDTKKPSKRRAFAEFPLHPNGLPNGFESVPPPERVEGFAKCDPRKHWSIGFRIIQVVGGFVLGIPWALTIRQSNPEMLKQIGSLCAICIGIHFLALPDEMAPIALWCLLALIEVRRPSSAARAITKNSDFCI